jgi:hypothetical protein
MEFGIHTLVVVFSATVSCRCATDVSVYQLRDIMLIEMNSAF